MPVNLNQYRGTIGVFKNRKLPVKKTDDPFSCRSFQKNLSKIQLIEIAIFLFVLTIRYVISLIGK